MQTGSIPPIVRLLALALIVASPLLAADIVLPTGTITGTQVYGPASQISTAVGTTTIVPPADVTLKCNGLGIKPDFHVQLGATLHVQLVPLISDLPDLTVNEDASITPIPFTIGNILGAPPSALTVTASSSNPTVMPVANLVFGGSGANRTLAMTLPANINGTSTITVTVSNGTVSNSDSFVLTVTAVPDPPTIADIADRTVNEDISTGAVAFTVNDVDTAATSLTLTGASSNTTLVPVANIVFGGSGANRTVTVTPAANQFGTATITVTVSDGALTAFDPFVLTVNSVPDPPTINDIADRTVNEDVSTGAVAFTLDDVDTAVTSLTLTGASSNTALVPVANIVFGGSGANRTVTVTPAANQFGTATITVTVSDGTLTASDPFVLTVNSVPDPPTISDIANRTVNQGTSTGAVAFTVGDVDTALASLTPTAASSNTSLVPVANITFGGSGASRTVTVVPAAGQSGTATITVTISDGTLTASDTFVLTVNGPPTISNIADRPVNEDISTGAIAFTIGDVETAAASLTVARSSSNTTLVPTANMVLGGSGTSRTLTIMPAANLSGTATITVTVTDGGGLTAIDTFVLTVVPVNDPPTVAIAAAASPATLYGTSTTLSALGADVDDAENSLTYTWAVTGTPPGPVSFGTNGTNAAKSTVASFSATGTYQFQVTIADPLAATATSVVNVSNVPTNATVQMASGSQTVLESDGVARIPVVCSPATANPITITWTQTGIPSAAASGQVVIPGGQSTASILLTGINNVRDDRALPQGQSSTVTLTSIVGGALGALKVTTLSVTDDEPTPVVRFGASTTLVSEAAGNTTTIPVLLDRAADTTTSVTVLASGATGDATAPGSVTIPAGALSASFVITPVVDATVESDETVTYTLSSPSGATLGTPSACVATIVDDDTTTQTVRMASASSTVLESDAPSVMVTRSIPSSGDLAVRYRVFSGPSATGPGLKDYLVSIPDGQASAPMTLPTFNDAISQGNRTFTVKLISIDNGTANIVPISEHTYTVIDDDAPASLLAPTLSVAEGTWIAPLSVTVTPSAGATAYAAIVGDGQAQPVIVPGVNSQAVVAPVDLPPGAWTLVAVSASQRSDGTWATGPAIARRYLVLADGQLGMPGSFGTEIASATSPACVELALVTTDLSVVEVSSSINGVALGTVPVTPLGYSTAFADARLSPDGATDVQTRIIDGQGRQSVAHRMIRWGTTSLDGTSALVLRAGDSLRFAAGSTKSPGTQMDVYTGILSGSEEGHLVTSVSASDATHPAGSVCVTYARPGTYIARAVIDGVELGRCTVTAVSVSDSANDKIICETSCPRPYRLALQGASAAGQIDVQGGQADELLVSGVTSPDYLSYLDFTLTAQTFPSDRLRYPVLVARIHGSNAVLMAKPVAAFQIEGPNPYTVQRIYYGQSEGTPTVLISPTQRPWIAETTATRVIDGDGRVTGIFPAQQFYPSVAPEAAAISLARVAVNVPKWWAPTESIRVSRSDAVTVPLVWTGQPSAFVYAEWIAADSVLTLPNGEGDSGGHDWPYRWAVSDSSTTQAMSGLFSMQSSTGIISMWDYNIGYPATIGDTDSIPWILPTTTWTQPGPVTLPPGVHRFNITAVLPILWWNPDVQYDTSPNGNGRVLRLQWVVTGTTAPTIMPNSTIGIDTLGISSNPAAPTTAVTLTADHGRVSIATSGGTISGTTTSRALSTSWPSSGTNAILIDTPWWPEYSTGVNSTTFAQSFTPTYAADDEVRLTLSTGSTSTYSRISQNKGAPDAESPTWAILGSAVSANLRSGNLFLAAPMVVNRTARPAPELILCYNSQETLDHGYGIGWRSNWDIHTIGGYIIDETGRRCPMSGPNSEPAWKYESNPAGAATGAFLANEYGRSLRVDGSIRYFNQAGWMVRTTLATGEEWRVVRDTVQPSKALKVTDALGATLLDLVPFHIASSASTRRGSLASSECGTWIFTYDQASGYMDSVDFTATGAAGTGTYQLLDAAGMAVSSQKLTFTYESIDSTNAAAVNDPNLTGYRRLKTVDYDAPLAGLQPASLNYQLTLADRPVTLTDPLLATTTWRLLSPAIDVTGPDGVRRQSSATGSSIGATGSKAQVVIDRDAERLPAKITRTLEPGVEQIIGLKYNENFPSQGYLRLLTSRTSFAVTGIDTYGGCKDLVERFAYSSATGTLGCLAQTIDAAGGITRYGYSSGAKPVLSSIIDPRGKIWKPTYQGQTLYPNGLIWPSGRTSTSTVDTGAASPTLGLPTSSSDAYGFAITALGYDGLHRTISTTAMDGSQTTTTYDPLGRVVVEASGPTANRRTVSLSYDVLGRLRKRSVSSTGSDQTLSLTATQPGTVVTPTPSTIPDETWDYTTGTAGTPTVPVVFVTHKQGTRTVEVDAIDLAGRLREHRIPMLINGSQGTSTTSYAYDADTGWLASVTDAKGTIQTYAYDSAGRATSVSTNLPSATVTTAYNGLDWPVSTTDAVGSTTTQLFDPCGRPSTTMNALGGWSVNFYDQAGNHTQRQLCDGPPETTIIDDDGQNIGSVNQFGTTITAIPQKTASGRTTTMTAKVGTTALSWSSATVEDFAARSVISTLSGMGPTVTTTSTSDIFGQVASQVSTITGTAATTTTAVRDRFGRPWASTSQATFDGTTRNLVSTTGYDSTFGAVKTSTSPWSVGSTTAYDATTGQVTSVTSTLGQIWTVNLRDELGRVTRETLTIPAVSGLTPAQGAQTLVTNRAFNNQGLVAWETGSDGITTTFTYDLAGRRLTATSGANTTTWTYDALGNVNSITDPAQRKVIRYYDALGRLQWETRGSDRWTSVYDPLTHVLLCKVEPGNRKTLYGYDTRGRLATVTDPRGKVVTYSYDDLDRVIAIKHGDNVSEGITYVGASSLVDEFTERDGRKRKHIYSAAGELDRVDIKTSAGAIEETLTYGRTLLGSPGVRGTTLASLTDGTEIRRFDAAGRLVQLTEPGQAAVTYVYDATGKLAQRDGTQNAQTYTYDTAKGRLSQVTGTGGAAALSYDVNGRISGLTLPNSLQRTYQYDAAGAVSQVQEILTGSPTETWTVARDARGRVARMDGPQGTSRYIYRDDRLMAEWNSESADTLGTWPGSSAYFEYDGAGNRTQQMRYDAISTRVEPFSTTLPPTVSPQSGTWAVSGGRLTAGLNATANLLPLAGDASRLRVPALVLAVDAPSLPRTLRVTLTQGANAIRVEVALRLNGVAIEGQISVLTTAGVLISQNAWQAIPSLPIDVRLGIDGSGTVCGFFGEDTASAVYGASTVTGALSGISLTVTAGSLSLDSLQWQVADTWKRTTTQYNDANRLVSELWTMAASNGGTVFSYDVGGRLTTETDSVTSAVQKSYTWDALSRLASLTDPVSNRKWLYGYAPGSQMRLSEVTQVPIGTTTQTTTFRMDDQGLLSRTVGGVTTICAGRGRTPLWESTAGVVTTYGRDPLGNVVSAITPTTLAGDPKLNQPVAMRRWRSNAYGEPTERFRSVTGGIASEPVAGSVGAGFGYRGMWRDASGQVKTDNRYYQPGRGAFTQGDPAKAGGNWYAYCDGDPVNRIDTTGLYWVWNETNKTWVYRPSVGDQPGEEDKMPNLGGLEQLLASPEHVILYSQNGRTSPTPPDRDAASNEWMDKPSYDLITPQFRSKGSLEGAETLGRLVFEPLALPVDAVGQGLGYDTRISLWNSRGGPADRIQQTAYHYQQDANGNFFLMTVSGTAAQFGPQNIYEGSTGKAATYDQSGNIVGQERLDAWDRTVKVVGGSVQLATTAFSVKATGTYVLRRADTALTNSINESLNFSIAPSIQGGNLQTNLTRLFNNARSRGVAQAWREEAALVRRTGQGTRQWTVAERQELLQTGKVSGYDGHHINNVANNDLIMAADPNNVEFATGPEHLLRHSGNFSNPTSGPLLKR
jgi:RHS repeat-associated protein